MHMCVRRPELIEVVVPSLSTLCINKRLSQRVELANSGDLSTQLALGIPYLCLSPPYILAFPGA